MKEKLPGTPTETLRRLNPHLWPVSDILRVTPGLHCSLCFKIPIFEGEGGQCGCGGTFRMAEGPTAQLLHENNSDRLASSPEPKQAVRDEPVAAEGGEGANAVGVPGRVTVRVISYRRRLIDTDNLTGKFFVDSLRYAGLIRDDSEKEIDYAIRQEKVETKEEERTVIEITGLNTAL